MALNQVFDRMLSHFAGKKINSRTSQRAFVVSYVIEAS